MLDVIKEWIARMLDRNPLWVKYEEEIHFLRNQISYLQNENRRLTDLVVETATPKAPERVAEEKDPPKPVTSRIPWPLMRTILEREDRAKFEKGKLEVQPNLEVIPNQSTDELEKELAVND